MQNKNTRRGFTLIELLVVVLIIGILAAVAVPQYQKVVERSKATEAMSMLSSIAKAYQVYYLANGDYATTFEELDVDIPFTGNTKFYNLAKDIIKVQTDILFFAYRSGIRQRIFKCFFKVI